VHLSVQYVVTLDGRVLKTPGRNPLELPNIELAMGIAAEWDAQSEKTRGIQPVNMPLMSLASTAIDQVEIDPQTAIRTCMNYLPTDSGLFIAPDFDRILLAKQQKYLFPVIEWYKKELNLDLNVTQSMATRIKHPDHVVSKLECILGEMVKSVCPSFSILR
jgi:chaperone required for assembly of F1-ATPase